MRILAALQARKIDAIAFEQGDDIGTTVAQWYDGSITHSPREALVVGGLEPRECGQCLDSVWGIDTSKAGCKLDGGKMRHCGREEYLSYLHRVMRERGLRVHTRERVTNVTRAKRSQLPDAYKGYSPWQVNEQIFAIRTLKRMAPTEGSSAGGAGAPIAQQQREYLARYIVLAIGASSKQHPLRGVGAASLAAHGSKIDSKLGDPKRYAGSHVLVVGSGPSGLESAVRSCSYGATSVTIVSRAANRDDKIGLQYVQGTSARLSGHVTDNVYMTQSYDRLKALHASGQLRVRAGAELADVNGSHAILSSGGAVRADHIVTAVGYTSDTALIEAMHFPGKRYSPTTLETAIRGIFIVGISTVQPWGAKRSLLGTNIEDTVREVDLAADEIAKRIATGNQTRAEGRPPSAHGNTTSTSL